jgi:metal-responsive CopG/Arc/MetJ family transcriptional regulator
MRSVKKFHGKPAPRKNRISILLNDSEMRALERYCEQYTVSNRSRLIRETLMRNILKRFDTDAPTLFDD